MTRTLAGDHLSPSTNSRYRIRSVWFSHNFTPIKSSSDRRYFHADFRKKKCPKIRVLSYTCDGAYWYSSRTGRLPVVHFEISGMNEWVCFVYQKLFDGTYVGHTPLIWAVSHYSLSAFYLWFLSGLIRPFLLYQYCCNYRTADTRICFTYLSLLYKYVCLTW